MLALRATRLIPGGGQPVVSPAVVLVEGGRVVDVDTTRAAPPPHADVVDLGDSTVLPGLVDAHQHLCFSPRHILDGIGIGEAALRDLTDRADRGPELRERWSGGLVASLAVDDATLLGRMEANALGALAAGITTVRDLGDRTYLGLALRERWAADGVVGPELLVAGPPITRTKGHCWFLGGEADGIEDLRAAAAERARRGCDVVKVMATGGLITPGFAPQESQYGLAGLRAVVEEASEHGLGVAAHAHGRQGIADSVAAGVRSLEHCSFLTAAGVEADWAVVEDAVARGTFVGATIALLPGAPIPVLMARLQPLFEENLRRAHAMGARVVCGSDAGVAPAKPHDVLPHGIVQLARAGLPNAAALDAATSVAADACGVGDRKGRVAPGSDADLVVVDGNPLVDIEAVLRVRAVFRAGTRVR